VASPVAWTGERDDHAVATPHLRGLPTHLLAKYDGMRVGQDVASFSLPSRRQTTKYLGRRYHGMNPHRAHASRDAPRLTLRRGTRPDVQERYLIEKCGLVVPTGRCEVIDPDTGNDVWHGDTVE
jgi:hypothetical protein